MNKLPRLVFAGSLACIHSLSAQVYPSAGTALVIPGGYVAPADPEYLKQFPDGESVRQWEIQNADLILGGDIGTIPSGSAQPYVFGYMYNQKLEFNPGWLEMSLRYQAEAAGEDYESLFLHFAEDTWLRIKDPSDGALTPFGGFPYAAGWTTQPDHGGFLIYQQPPYDKPVWQYHEQEGGLYVYLFEPFDRLQLQLSSTANAGNLVVEYSAGTEWRELAINDGTNNLSRSGEVSWTPPSDWQRVQTHDGSGKSYGGGPFLGKQLIRDGGYFYVVRLMWRNGSGTVPRLADIRLKNWLPLVAGGAVNTRIENTSGADKNQPVSNTSTAEDQQALLNSAPLESIRLVRGWDPDNDKDGNGYVDDEEFASLANPYARARFKYEARVVPLGSMWSSRSSWCRPNFFHPRLGEFLSAYYRRDWQSNGLFGAYNDDFYKLLEGEFHIVSGGRLLEFDALVSSPAAQEAYKKAFAKVLSEIKTGTERFLGANISMLNPYAEQSEVKTFLPAFSLLLREGYIRPSLGLSGWFGYNRSWDTMALAASDRWSILMAMVNHGSRVHRLGNTRENWEKDLESSLAQFYLMNVPGKTFFHGWNQWFHYGSGNTASHNFYQAGIPKNMAYHPQGMLSVDIGKPDPIFPENREPVAYMMKTSGSDYFIVGYSNDTQLVDDRQNLIPVTASNTYYLSRSDSEVVPGGPATMILARNYTKGLVLFRTDFFGHNAGFQNSVSQEVLLPGVYRRVRYDGSLSEPMTSITLRGYEGGILQKID